MDDLNYWQALTDDPDYEIWADNLYWEGLLLQSEEYDDTRSIIEDSD